MRKKFMKIVTDSTPLEEPKNPDNCNVFNLFKLFASDDEVEVLRKRYENGGMGYGTAKQELFDKYWEYFRPYRGKRQELENSPDYVEKVLEKGAAHARDIAGEKLTQVKKATGFIS